MKAHLASPSEGSTRRLSDVLLQKILKESPRGIERRLFTSLECKDGSEQDHRGARTTDRMPGEVFPSAHTGGGQHYQSATIHELRSLADNRCSSRRGPQTRPG